MHTKQNQPVVEPHSIDLRGHTMGSHTWINTLRFWRKKTRFIMDARAICQSAPVVGRVWIFYMGIWTLAVGGCMSFCVVVSKNVWCVVKVWLDVWLCLKLYLVMFSFDENEVLCSWEESRWSLGKGNIIFCLFEIIAFVIEGWLLKWFWFFFVWGMNDAIYIVFLRWLLMDPMLFFYYEF